MFLVFDVVSENFKVEEATRINISDGESFWKPEPYIEVSNTYLYETPKTMGQQYTIITEDGTAETTRIYTRLFSRSEIKSMLNECGFTIEKFYKNLKGEPLNEKSETYGVFARKNKKVREGKLG